MALEPYDVKLRCGEDVACGSKTEGHNRHHRRENLVSQNLTYTFYTKALSHNSIYAPTHGLIHHMRLRMELKLTMQLR